MVWAKRDGVAPPPDFWADFLANVDALFPGASLDERVLKDLYGLVVDEWRDGRQVNVIVRQLCACDGTTVEPSEGAKRRLQKKRGLAKAPEDAERGEIFGIDELREAGILGKLSAKLAVIDARLRNPRVRPAMRERYVRERGDLVQAIQTSRKQAYWTKGEDIYQIPELPQHQKSEAPIRSYRIEVLAGGGWAGNAARYATESEAEAAGDNLLSRWTAAEDFRVVPSTDFPNVGEVVARPTPKDGHASTYDLHFEQPEGPEDHELPKRKQPKARKLPEAMSVRPRKQKKPVIASEPQGVKPDPNLAQGLDDDIADALIVELSRKA